MSTDPSVLNVFQESCATYLCGFAFINLNLVGCVDLSSALPDGLVKRFFFLNYFTGIWIFMLEYFFEESSNLQKKKRNNLPTSSK